MSLSEYCEYCGKQATNMCGECKLSAYCCREHQVEHWRTHKQHCPVLKSYRLRSEEEEINQKRIELRKKYFENFMYKIYDTCIKTAQEIIVLERGHIQTTRQIFNELEYGISICLYARSWLNIKNEAKAVIIINNYLDEKMHFLKDMRDIVDFEQLYKKQKKAINALKKKMEEKQAQEQNFGGAIPNPRQMGENQQLQVQNNLKQTHSIIKQFSIKKVSLIAAVANILYATKLPVIEMYEIYTHHIEKMFGPDSYEASNCFFMAGSHYMQNSEYYKAIACFMRAAEIRGHMAGDCYYNLGIIYQLLNKSKLALMMFENAAKLRETQFSENSLEVADVYHNIAIIYQSLGNFKGAIENLEKIVLIYSKDKGSEEYKNAKESIKSLEDAFRKHMERINDGTIPQSGLFKEIKKSIRKATKITEQEPTERSIRSDKDKDGNLTVKGNDNTYLRITDAFLKKLNQTQALYLSQLQIELAQCDTYFMAATVVGNSLFLKVLRFKRLEQLVRSNQTLFEHVNIQKLSKRGVKDLNFLQ